jgi:hypothetical protein
MARATCALLLAALLAAGCGFRRGDPLPDDPPADFRLAIRVAGAADWPWDGTLRVDGASGIADYDVVFRSPRANRRGSETLEGGALRELWTAAAAGGLFDRAPVPEGAAGGPVVVEGLGLGLIGRVAGDPATDPGLAAILAAVRLAAPPRVLRPPPAPPAPR